MSKKKPDSANPPANTSRPVADATSALVPLFLSAQVTQQTSMTSTSGPLPPPEIIAKYNAVLPGLAERLTKMAEDEAAHRRTVEREALAIQSRDQVAYRRSELCGQIFALSIGLAAIGGAVYAGTHGAQWVGSFLGTSGVTGLVSAFILGRHYLLKNKQQDFTNQMEAAKAHQTRVANAKEHATQKSGAANSLSPPQ